MRTSSRFPSRRNKAGRAREPERGAVAVLQAPGACGTPRTRPDDRPRKADQAFRLAQWKCLQDDASVSGQA